MRHSIIAPTHADARRLASDIQDEGHFARVTNINGFVVVLAHAPLRLVNRCCKRVAFDAGTPHTGKPRYA